MSESHRVRILTELLATPTRAEVSTEAGRRDKVFDR